MTFCNARNEPGHGEQIHRKEKAPGDTSTLFKSLQQHIK